MRIQYIVNGHSIVHEVVKTEQTDNFTLKLNCFDGTIIVVQFKSRMDLTNMQELLLRCGFIDLSKTEIEIYNK